MRFGLAGKIFVASTLLVVAVLGISFGVTSIQANRTADASIGRALAATRRAVENQLSSRTHGLATAAGVSASVPQYRARLLNAGRHNDALDQANDVRSLAGAAWVLVTDAEGILIARTDQPEVEGIDVSRGALIAKALSGDTASGAFADDVNHKLFEAVSIPLRADARAAPQGALVATYELNDSLAQTIKEATNSEVVFFGLDTLNRPFVVGSTMPREQTGPALAAALRVDSLRGDTTGISLSAKLGDAHLVGLARPIRSAGGDVFGGFVALRSRDAELAAFQTLRRTMLWAIALGVLLALASAYVLARQIAGPVRGLALATRRAQDGDYGVSVEVKSRDEIGELAVAFKRLIEDLKEKQDLVEYIMSATSSAATQPIAAMPAGRRTVAAQLEAGGEAVRPGTVFANRYEVKEILGMGGMGVVYRALDRELQEPIAIKTLRPEALVNDSVALERFKQEIRLARKIAHRNVVRTYDLGEIDGMYFLTMEYVEGTSLKQLIQSRGMLPTPVTLTIGKQLCRALEVAHEQGVIHRDIKPQNMVVEPSGVLKVMDFGIARLANPPKDKAKGLTEAGMTIGTPDYMSPEQLSGAELDARSDLYSAGVVLFECLTGRVPFEAETTWSLIAKHLEESPPDPRTFNPDVAEPLAAVILKAMGKDPAARYQTAGGLHDALAAIG